MAREVSCKALQSIIADVKAQGHNMQVFLAGTELTLEHLEKGKNRIDWWQFRLLMNNLTKQLGYQKEDYVRIGLGIFDSPLMSAIGFIARSLFNLPDFYLWFHNQDEDKVSKGLITCAKLSASHDEHFNFTISITIAEGYDPVPEFYWTSLGVMQGWPLLYGLEQIEVQTNVLEQGCEYYFKCPQTKAWLSFIRRLFGSPKHKKHEAQQLVIAYNEIHEQNLRLEEENKALQQAHAKLEEAVKQTEQALEVKSNFINNISHEIRTPLNAIIGTNSLMLEEEKERNDKGNLLNIQHAAQSLLATFEDIIDYSALGKQTIEITPTIENGKHLLQSVLLPYNSRAKERNLLLNAYVDDSLNKPLKIDWKRVSQILRALLDNAIKYTQKGGIIVQAKIKDEQLDISVQDTGIGISPLEVGELLAELDSSLPKNTKLHLGIGLPLAFKLSQLMQGSLHCEPLSNPGSRFRLVVPFAENAQTTVVAENNLQVLVVEDVKVNQIIVERMVKKLGYQVAISPNGQEGYHRAIEEPFDLVLMDIMMPVMDGIDATKLIRQEKSKQELPIIIVSANISPDDYSTMEALGANRCISKPLNFDTLAQTINEVLLTQNNEHKMDQSHSA